MENEYYKKYEPFFGSWYIKRFIGAGSYGKVFEIERKDAFGTVYTGALKVITIPADRSELEEALSDGMGKEGASTYFRDYAKAMNREIALMSKLKGHSNIVSYEDHDLIQHEDGIGWDILIRMELLTPLTEYLKENRTFARREVVRLGIELCRALELCQRFNIIHRDIKPANIFVSDADDFKLGDFGVARIANESNGASTRAGTLNYMAPEIYRGEKYTSSVDLYSLGLVMYQLLNDKRLPFFPSYPEPVTFESRNIAQTKRVGGEPLPPPANASGRLAEIVLKACAPNPADRYESPALMRQALESIQYTESEAKDIYPEGDTLPMPVTVEPENEPAVGVLSQEQASDDATENIWVNQKNKNSAAEQESEAERTVFLFKEQELARQKAEAERKAAKEAAARRAEEERHAAEEAVRRKEAERKAAEEAARKEAAETETPHKEEKTVPVTQKKSKLPLVLGGGVLAAMIVVSFFVFPGRIKRETPTESASSKASVLSGGVGTASSAETDVEASSDSTVAELIDSGSCGENATWELYKDGTLYIRGNGAMQDYEWDYQANPTTDVPWHAMHLQSIKNVVIEDGITEIGNNAFVECDSMKSVSIPDTVVRIGEGAFRDCYALTSVEIPDSVRKIDSSAFDGCSELVSVKLSQNLETLGDWVFAGCYHLQSITIPGGVKKIGTVEFISCFDLETVIIEEGVETIGYSAFYGCESLKELTIPRSVQAIEDSAFGKCTNLKTVGISKSCNVGIGAFPDDVAIGYYE